jgi:hypothetical protein
MRIDLNSLLQQAGVRRVGEDPPPRDRAPNGAGALG